MSPDQYITKEAANRLFEIAEAVLQATQEILRSSGKCPYPPELRGDLTCPECLKPYMVEEIEQATAFLVRMGVLVMNRPS